MARSSFVSQCGRDACRRPRWLPQLPWALTIQTPKGPGPPRSLAGEGVVPDPPRAGGRIRYRGRMDLVQSLVPKVY